MLNSMEVPQADVLPDVIKTVRFISLNKGCTDTMIASHIGKGVRQGRYYRHAAQLLGLIDNDKNYAWVLQEGERFLDLNRQEQIVFLVDRIMKLKAFQLTRDLIIKNPGCTEEAIEDLLTSEGITITTGDRRTKTIVSWLVHINLIRQAGRSFYIV